MTLSARLLAALVALWHVFDEHPLTREEWLVRYWDATSGYECHLIASMGCLEGSDPSCPRNLRAKWHGPACMNWHPDGQKGTSECRDCVHLAHHSYEVTKGTEADKLNTLTHGCGIPCTPRLDVF